MTAFGFLASEEVLQAGLTNIGLRDRKWLVLRVPAHLSERGHYRTIWDGMGEPVHIRVRWRPQQGHNVSKVPHRGISSFTDNHTRRWGESAGAFSIGFQLVMNNGDPAGLFRAAVMVGSRPRHLSTCSRLPIIIQESGSPYALHNVSAGQPYYDFLVDYAGCTGQVDTLECLRRAPADQIVAAVDMTPNGQSYTEHNLAWQPRLDGDLFTQNPQRSVLMGQYAKVRSNLSCPYINRGAQSSMGYALGADHLR